MFDAVDKLKNSHLKIFENRFKLSSPRNCEIPVSRYIIIIIMKMYIVQKYTEKMKNSPIFDTNCTPLVWP